MVLRQKSMNYLPHLPLMNVDRSCEFLRRSNWKYYEHKSLFCMIVFCSLLKSTQNLPTVIFLLHQYYCRRCPGTTGWIILSRCPTSCRSLSWLQPRDWHLTWAAHHQVIVLLHVLRCHIYLSHLHFHQWCCRNHLCTSSCNYLYREERFRFYALFYNKYLNKRKTKMHNKLTV